MNTANHPSDDAPAAREARVLAVLLGETSPTEAAAVAQLLRDDTALRAYHDELRALLPLFREASQPGGGAVPDLRMDEARRAGLLEKLRRTPQPATENGTAGQNKPDREIPLNETSNRTPGTRVLPKTQPPNVIPWKKLLRENWGAFAACAAFALGGAVFTLQPFSRKEIATLPEQQTPVSLPTAPAGIESIASLAVDLSSLRDKKENAGAAGEFAKQPKDFSSERADSTPVSGQKMVPLKVSLPPVILNGTPEPITRSRAAPIKPVEVQTKFVEIQDSSAQELKADQSEITAAPVSSVAAPVAAPKSPHPATSAPAGYAGKISSGSRSALAPSEKPAAVDTLSAMDESSGITIGTILASGENGQLVYKKHSPSANSARSPIPPNMGAFGASGITREKNQMSSRSVTQPQTSDTGAIPSGAVVGSLTNWEIALVVRALKDTQDSNNPDRPDTFAAENPFSTFSLNVSDVSFRLAAEALRQGRWPDTTTLRTEEFVNALAYDDPPPAPGQAVSLAQEQARDPFAHNRNLLRLSVQTASAGRNARQPLNLTVLLDTSGSMERADRQEIIAVALDALAGQLGPNDTVSVLGFSRTPRLLLDKGTGTAAAQQLRQLAGNIPPEGGTNLELALQAAYRHNLQTRSAAALNRVVLLTDGATNLGDADPAALAALITRNKTEHGTVLDCFGVGFDGYNDAMLETLARASHGRYAYLNNAAEAREDFAQKLAGALQVAAQNVKVQVEFNPARVASYRLFGYEKHRLNREDFRDNTVAAAGLGAAESGTAVYHIEPKPDGTGDIGVVRVRYQDPRSGAYHEREWSIPHDPAPPALENAAPGIRRAATAALLAEKLQGVPQAQSVSFPALEKIIRRDDSPENKKLRELVESAQRLDP